MLLISRWLRTTRPVARGCVPSLARYLLATRRFAAPAAPTTGATSAPLPAPQRPKVANNAAAAAAEEFPDLSHHSQPLGVLYPVQPATRANLDHFQLTQAQIDQYLQDGYIGQIPVLSPPQCDQLLADYQSFLRWDRDYLSTSDGLNDAHCLAHPGAHLFHEYHSSQAGDANNVLSHMLGHWRISAAFHDLVFHPAIIVPVAQLLAAKYQPIEGVRHRPETGLVPVQFWHDQLFAKPPHYGGSVAYHQDYSYWTRTFPCNHITVHIALDEQTEANGCLRFVPGSQRWKRRQFDEHLRIDRDMPLPVTDFNFADIDSISTVLLDSEKKQFQPVPSTLRQGAASLHDPFTVHGSFPNRTDRPRRAAVLNYFVAGTKSHTDEELLNGVGVIPRGQAISGRFFPLVFDPQWMQH